MKTPSFSRRLKAGWSKEQLMKHYVISEQQYVKLLACLDRLHDLEAQAAQGGQKK